MQQLPLEQSQNGTVRLIVEAKGHPQVSILILSFIILRQNREEIKGIVIRKIWQRVDVSKTKEQKIDCTKYHKWQIDCM